MKKIGMLAAVVIAAGAAAAWYFSRNGEFLYSGTMEATEVDVSSRLTSLISAKEVSEGEAVTRGQGLFRLDCDEFKLAADIARRDLERAEQLYKSGSMPRENYDRIKYKRDDSALRVDWCAVKSPIKGRVLYTYHEPGEMVSPGTKLATLADLSELWAYIYVPQAVATRLSVGMELAGFLPELGMRKFPGRISVVNEEAEFTPKNVQTRKERTRLVFGVKVTFRNPDGILKPGTTIEVGLPQGL